MQASPRHSRRIETRYIHQVIASHVLHQQPPVILPLWIEQPFRLPNNGIKPERAPWLCLLRRRMASVLQPYTADETPIQTPLSLPLPFSLRRMKFLLGCLAPMEKKPQQIIPSTRPPLEHPPKVPNEHRLAGLGCLDACQRATQ